MEHTSGINAGLVVASAPVDMQAFNHSLVDLCAGYLKGLQSMLLALLQLKPAGFEAVATSVWACLVMHLGSWIIGGDHGAERVLLGTSHVAGLSRLYMLYSEACSRQPNSWHEHRGKELAFILPHAGRGLCLFMEEPRPASIARSDWEELSACPGLIDGALTNLAGLAQYLHKQHVARQGGPAGGPNGGDSKSSSSRSQKQHSKTSSKKSTSSSSSTQTPCVIGASSFSQLLLQPHHEMVAVAGGTRAIMAHAKWLEQTYGSTLLNSTGMSGIRGHFADEFRAPVLIVEKTVLRSPVTTAQGSAAAGAAAAEEPTTVGGAAQEGRGLSASEASGALPVAAVLPVLQLLLELTALLCSKEELLDHGCIAAGMVVAGARHRKEELQPFYTASAPLLLQVVWLIAPQEYSKGERHQTWHELFQLFLSGARSAGAPLNTGWEYYKLT